VIEIVIRYFDIIEVDVLRSGDTNEQENDSNRQTFPFHSFSPLI